MLEASKVKQLVFTYAFLKLSEIFVIQFIFEIIGILLL